MTLKCPICSRTFSRRTAYSQHIQFCLKKVDEEEYSDASEIDTQSNNNEVVILFLILLNPKKYSY